MAFAILCAANLCLRGSSGEVDMHGCCHHDGAGLFTEFGVLHINAAMSLRCMCFFLIFCNFVKVCIIEYCINYCFMAQTELDHNVHSIRFMHEHVMNIGISCQFEWSVLFLYGKSVIYGC